MLGQKEQYGCIAANRAYDHMSVHLDCDGAVCSPKGIQGTESSQERSEERRVGKECSS